MFLKPNFVHVSTWNEILRVLHPLLVPLVEFSFQGVALPFLIHYLHPQLVYNRISLVFGHACLVFVKKPVKEYQTPSCSIGITSLSMAQSFSSWWNVKFDELFNSCSLTASKRIICCIYIHKFTLYLSYFSFSLQD